MKYTKGDSKDPNGRLDRGPRGSPCFFQGGLCEVPYSECPRKPPNCRIYSEITRDIENGVPDSPLHLGS
jgi:hypothetical protein